jgi:glycosyltransferase involved in cell wall biosynthesis
MESLAMGVPVITVDSRGCREVVRHEVDGLVLADFGVEALVDAMTSLQDDRAALQKYAEQAIEGRRRFDRQDFVTDQFEIFKRLSGKEV